MSQESLMKPLLDIITASTHTMQAELKAAGIPEPWLAKPELHPWDVDIPPMKYWDARKDLVSALGMMSVGLQSPVSYRFVYSQTVTCTKPDGTHRLRLPKCMSTYFEIGPFSLNIPISIAILQHSILSVKPIF